MIDFLNFQKAIKDYIQDNLPTVLEEGELEDFDAYIDDVVDLDIYKKKKQLFYAFSAYEYSTLSNMSNTELFNFSVYMVFQNDKRNISQESMLKYSAGFYEMFARSGNTFAGLSDFGIIQRVQFYDNAEGNPEIKVCELSIQLLTER